LSPRPAKGRSLPLPDLGAFLKTFILGIVTGVSDMLQGVQGKKSTEDKRKIVRSIGFLVTFLGGSISIVAPQVCSSHAETMVTHIPRLWQYFKQ
jgi:serine/threonine-protein kinase ATR